MCLISVDEFSHPCVGSDDLVLFYEFVREEASAYCLICPQGRGHPFCGAEGEIWVWVIRALVEIAPVFFVSPFCSFHVVFCFCFWGFVECGG